MEMLQPSTFVYCTCIRLLRLRRIVVEVDYHVYCRAAPLLSFIPSEDDVKLAKETKRILAQRLSSTKPCDLRAMNPL